METDLIFTILFVGLEIILHPVSAGIIWSFAGIALLLLCSALVSGSEVAFFSITPSDRIDLESAGTRKSRLVLKLLNIPERLLATILITNNFINIAIVIISAYTLNNLMDIISPDWLEFIIQVVIVTFLLLLFGEILPKVYANANAVSFSQFMAYPLEGCRRFFYPLSSILILSTSIVNRRMAKKGKNISIDELSDALDLAAEDIEEDKAMLEGIIKFGNIDVREIMKARIDVVAVDIKTKLDELIKIIINSGYSRIPIFSENFDTIKGILYIKDLLPHLSKGSKFKWQTLIRPPYYVPENKKIDDLLHEFQTKKMHMAIVVDEYGGTSGIITLEDILEEIVGEITDESDEEEVSHRKIDEHTYVFEAKIQLNDFYKITGLSNDFFDPVRGDADTLAGVILEIKGEFPKAGDNFSYEGLQFTVVSVDKRRIRQIRVILDPGLINNNNKPGG